jgi:outer membrane protein assembly complex protein YaeT
MTAPEAPPVPPRRRKWWRRAAIALVVCAAAAVAIVHLPFVRAAALARLVTALEQQGVRLHADRISYNLFTLRVALEGVTVAAEGAAQPFLELDRARVDLPWSIVTGAYSADVVEVNRLRVMLVRGADGSLNLPDFGADDGGGGFEGPVLIDRLLVSDLSVLYDDATANQRVEVRGLALDMRASATQPLSGAITMREAATIQIGGRATTVDRLSGTLAFDGVTLRVDPLELTAPEGTARFEGTIDAFGSDPEIEVDYTARIDAARASTWTTLTPAPSGVLSLAGAMTGDRSAPAISAEVATDGLAWSTLGPVTIDARVSLADSLATIDSARIGVSGGEVTADGRVVVDGDGESTLNGRWRGLDLSRLLTAVPDLRVRPGALSDGTLAMTWTGTDVLGGRATIVTAQRALTPREGVLPLGGRLNLSTDARRWTLTGTPEVAGSIQATVRATGRLADDLDAAPLGGSATIDVADLAAALEQLEITGLVPDVGQRNAVRGATSAVLTLGGTLGAPRATGTVDGAGLYFKDTGPATLTARVDASTRVVRVEDVRVDLGANHLTGQATLGIEANTLAGTLQAQLPDLAAVSAALPEAWRPAGAASIAAVLGGALDNPAAQVEITSKVIQVAGQTIDSVESRVRLVDRVAIVDAFVLRQQDGTLTATGRYAIDGGRYAFTANGTGLVVAPIPTGRAVEPVAADPAQSGTGTTAATMGTWPIRTRVDLQVQGEGTIDAPQAGGQLQLAHLDWGTYQMGPATADVTLADGHARVLADLPAVKGTVDATLELESRRLTATATLSDAELAALARATGPAGPVAEAEEGAAAIAGEPVPLTGTVRLNAAAEGLVSDLASMTVVVDLGLTGATVNGVPVRAERTARFRHEAGAIAAEDVTLRIGEATLTARGRIGAGSTAADGLAVTLVGTMADLTPILQLAPGMEGVTVGGNVDLNLLAFGPVETPDITAYVTVTEGSVATTDLPPASDVTLAATYSAGMVNVSSIRARWQGAELLALGHAPLSLLGDTVPAAYRATLPPALGPARFDVRVLGLSPEALRPFLAAESIAQITGNVDVSADVEATAFDFDAVTAEVRLDRAAVELARVPLAQTQPTRLRLARRRLDVVDWNWAGTGNEFSVRGHVLFGEEAATLDLGVVGSLDLRMISAFAPGLATAGRASLDVTATGQVGEPVIAGSVAIKDVDVIVRDPRLAITGMTGDVQLTRNRVSTSGITASANGGTVSIIGGADYRDFAVRDGAITVTGRGLAIEAVEGLRTELNTDLTFAMANGEPTLGGRVTIVRGDYRQPLRLTEQLFSTLETRTSGPGADSDGLLSRLQLDLAIVSAQDIAVDNNYGRLDVASNLRVTGTPAAPILGGRLAIREGGEVYLGGQTYTLQRGTVDFTNATRIEPNFDIALETRVRSNDITLELTGTPQTLDVGLRGPGLSQQDAISLLLTGQKADVSTVAYSDVARGQLLMLLSGELLSTAGRAVGLDSVQISRGLGGAASTFDLLATDSDPEARLTLAKDLSREVELIMSQSLRDTGDITWIATYRPLRRLEFRAATDDESRETYEFRHELHFGGDPAAATDAAERPPGRRVSAIHIEGEPGVPNADLLTALRLGVGDRFDYFNWQRDRDRLAALYHDRGFFEARISAQRQDEGADALTLLYVIDPGPRTLLQVEGFALPGDTIEEMKEAWSQSVFDGFLIDDVEQLAQRALVQARYLQGSVEAAITTTADGREKQLLVSIAPGPRSDTRRIEFVGNAAESDGDLRSVVEVQDQRVSVWMDPATIETALEAHYRSIGHLTANVTVEAAQFQNGTAVLPVRIEEGPEYRIGVVGVSGAAFRTADAVRKVTGLESGEPYRPAEVEPARRRVEVDYLGAGYNDVSVSTIVGIDEERAIADVIFAVAEGPQQILQDVVIRGAGVTSEGTINRALNLDEGRPLDMTSVYAAQKRLYDTSVFQRVDIDVEPIAGTADAAPGTQPVRALVGLQELPRFRFRYGSRLSDLPGPAEGARQIRPALVVDFLNRNVFGRAIAAGVAGQIESNRRLARGILSLPSPFRVPVTTNVFLTWSRQTLGNTDEGVTPFVDDVLELTFEQRVKPARTMAVTWGYTYSRGHQFLLEPDPFIELDEIEYLARLTGTYAWDTRDDPSNATRGWFHSSGLEYAPGKLGSTLKFVRYLAQQYYFHRVGRHAVLASALRVGLAGGLDDQELEQRFFTGGGTSVRGFSENGVGRRDALGYVVGGSGLLQFNQEVRFPVYRWFRGVGFLDMGNVFPTVRDLSFSDLSHGAGVGLRIHSPFAVIRLDYGIPLTNRDTQRARWYFGIGQTF